jgi:probable phosphoglycerate mutase
LSVAGREAAERVAAQIASELAGLDGAAAAAVVLTSPLRRARETAAAIARTIRQAPVCIAPDLAEVDFGAADGLTWDELVAAYPDLSDAVLAGANPDWPGGEGAAQVAGRERAAADEILLTARTHPVIVVSHGGLLPGIAARVSTGGIASWSFEPATARRLHLVAGVWISATWIGPVGVG